MTLCKADFFIHGLYQVFIKTDSRISIKDYRQNQSLKICFLVPFLLNTSSLRTRMTYLGT
jgi:hypothetical protein